MTDMDLTPNESVLLDLLAARHRMGEPEWSVPRATGALKTLAAKGLIDTRPHNASSKHVYASLTDTGRSVAVSETYELPAERKRNEDIRREAAALVEAGLRATELHEAAQRRLVEAEALEAHAQDAVHHIEIEHHLRDRLAEYKGSAWKARELATALSEAISRGDADTDGVRSALAVIVGSTPHDVDFEYIAVAIDEGGKVTLHGSPDDNEITIRRQIDGKPNRALASREVGPWTLDIATEPQVRDEFDRQQSRWGVAIADGGNRAELLHARDEGSAFAAAKALTAKGTDAVAIRREDRTAPWRTARSSDRGTLDIGTRMLAAAKPLTWAGVSASIPGASWLLVPPTGQEV